ncbi:terminase small subunit [Paraliobacillus sediminis]|uniref:terminase small subunit n=1 Tax=Paraliobacillus sediminis TaxID=1885916 RepID=UPI000E3CA578|nr:terminase small subunit [Paraliobacillus sediminis]
MSKKLSLKQQKFADEYIITGNASEAYKMAYKNVKKDSTARANSSRLLTNANVSAYIEERLEELKTEKVADQQEVMEYLTSVLRGEVQDEVLLVVSDGDFGSSVERNDKRSDTNDRTKAAELLGKRYAMWTDKKKIESDLGMNLVIDYGDDEEN